MKNLNHDIPSVQEGKVQARCGEDNINRKTDNARPVVPPKRIDGMPRQMKTIRIARVSLQIALFVLSVQRTTWHGIV